MVARINTGKNISKALNYNEQKIKAGTAEILWAKGFIKDTHNLSFYDKMDQFERLISLNDRTITNTLHVSLNFDPSEHFSNEKLIAIADRYMEEIGFGQQPYLIYNHFDAGHPHIHIVSTNIKPDGKRISMHNMGRNQSETARKKIEKEFDLVKAEGKNNINFSEPVSITYQKLVYGRSATKRAIANVLMVVLNNYRYTSLPELNAVLNLYNVAAETGQPDTRLAKFKGLVYRVLDGSGKKIGTPIKSSAFYMKPTLTFLEKKFEENESLRLPYKKRIQSTVKWILSKHLSGLNDLKKILEKESISLVVRTGKEGVIYGLTYVDHKTKTVFNGSDLGKEFSAKAILENFIKKSGISETSAALKQINRHPEHHIENKIEFSSVEAKSSKDNNIVAEISDAPISPAYVPYQLKKRKRKKKKQISI